MGHHHGVAVIGLRADWFPGPSKPGYFSVNLHIWDYIRQYPLSEKFGTKYASKATRTFYATVRGTFPP